MSKKQEIKNIFIDTSIFEENNFLQGNRIKSLLKLAEDGELNIVLPEITYREILNRIKKNTVKAVDRLEIFDNQAKIFKNSEALKSKFDKVNEDEFIELMKAQLDSELKKANVVFVPYSELNIKRVCERYFNGEAPFNNKRKQDEFPDALAMASIEKWCEENDAKCRVFAIDGDFKDYKSEHLEIEKDYHSFLSDKLIEIENNKKKKRLWKLDELFESKSHELIGMVESWLDDQLEDDSIYYEHTNYYEVHDVQINPYNITTDDYEVTFIDEDEIIIQTDVFVTYSVDLVIDDENSYHYDSEDKVAYYFDTTTENVTDDIIVPLELSILIDEEGNADDFELININRGHQLKV